jgi:hypothetical protein
MQTFPLHFGIISMSLEFALKMQVFKGLSLSFLNAVYPTRDIFNLII